MLDGVAGSNSLSLVSLRCVIGPENLRHPLNQSGAKFGHLLSAPATVHVFSRSSLSGVFRYLLSFSIGCCTSFSLG